MMGDIELKAGNLDLLYQDGFIRYVRLGNLEIIRMINHALRDPNWSTIPMQISNEKINTEEDAFQISYTANFQEDSINFEVNCQIEGKKDGSLIFIYDGIAKKDFHRNRIGFTVLHPIQICKGKKVRIIHSDGSRTESKFPELISPHQPFLDIQEMHWTLTEGIHASLIFEGEVFETEDQRNWTDASYKTYCTPLGLGFPVAVKEGDQIHQKVSLKVSTESSADYKSSKDLPISISLLDQVSELPQFGIVLNEGVETALIKQALQDLMPDYWRIELELDDDFGAALSLLKGAVEAGTPVELCVFSDQENPVITLEGLKPYFGTVKSLLLFGESTKTTSKNWLDSLGKLRVVFPQAKIYAGTDAFFTELNRDPVDAKSLDGITYSINPQVHAFDDQSLIETLEAQRYTVQSARKLYPDKKIRISPISFHMRWNPNATGPRKRLREPTGWTDKRQFTLFCAFWFLFSLKYLSESGASSYTYFELSGNNGWFKSKEEGLEKSPIYALREEIKQYTHYIPSQSSQQLFVDSVCLKSPEKTALLLVNWTKKKQTVSLPVGFQPIRYSQKWEKEALVWENLKSNGSEFYDLMPESLMWLEKEV
jgi:hypothetical protein